MLQILSKTKSLCFAFLCCLMLAISLAIPTSNTSAASSVGLIVNVDAAQYFPYEKVYAYGFYGGGSLCLPGCGLYDYVDVWSGTRTFTSYYAGHWWTFASGSQVMIEAYLGPNRTRYTYCWITIPTYTPGSYLEVYYNFDRQGNLSCSVGLSHS